MARTWTDQQRLAINTRDRTLLVSAAAGSGKTATLTERIISSLIDDKNPMDIGNMLIATFTNAAVEELRERIGKAIKDAAAAHPENKHLEAQVIRMKDAKILTITSFCNTILRMSAESVGLPPNYRIAEPAEAAILFSSTIEGLIEAAYEGVLSDVCTAEEFAAFADCLTGTRTEGTLAEAIGKVYVKLQATEGGIDSLLPLIDEYDVSHFESVEKTRFGVYIEAHTRAALREYEAAYINAIMLAGKERLDEKNLPKIESDLSFIRSALAADGYEAMRTSLKSITFEGFSHGKEDETDFYRRVKVLRPIFKADVERFINKFYSYETEEWISLYKNLHSLFTTFYRFLKKFYAVFMEEKRRRGMCEFSDVERYAYQALYNEDGSTTELAAELRERFDAIYVDEYQDVNGLQSKVFSAIARPDNRFMVGDIKQSIYVFRSARPEIFAEMKSTFPELGTEGDFPSASLFMSKNFRCDKNVVDFVNGIFDTMFELNGESIGYKPQDRLEFAKIYEKGDAPTNHVPEIHVLSKPKKDGDEEKTEGGAEGKETDNFTYLAESIADKILTLLDTGRLANGKRITKRDICIMMRGMGDNGEKLSSVLKSRGINSSLENGGDLFMSEEVLLTLSLLYSIDNPRKDIYLASLMCSPLYGFTADELLRIRKYAKTETLWEALSKYAEGTKDPKACGFIASLSRYRELSLGMSTDALISLIFRESGILALAARYGRRDNLTLFHAYARKYEQTSFKGLYSFLSYISEVIAGEEKLPVAKEDNDSDSVSIITIHKSKGLEYPVCILANASANGGGSSDKLRFSDNFGIAMRPRDTTGLALIENPAFNVVTHRNEAVDFEEELRVLYVALTRARERLYVYATLPKASYLDEMEERRAFLSPYFASRASSLLDIIMLGRNCGLLITDEAHAPSDTSQTETEEKADKTESKENAKGCGKDEYLKRFTFENPLSHLERIPEKISVSKLTPTVLDGSEMYETPISELHIDKDGERHIDKEITVTVPRFISGKDDRESAKRGIATHMIMQFCDLESLAHSTRAELSRLVSSEFISNEDADRVRIDELDAFVRSPLFAEMRGAKRLYRELRFNAKLPAERFSGDDELRPKLKGRYVLVQGVIDCIIEREDGSLHLVDYKTDRLKSAELASPELADKRLRDTHSAQLSYYSDAIFEIFGKRPAKVGIYSLHAGREIDL